MIKAQTIKKLVNDEVLYQHVDAENLVITDDTARDFIKNLPYFQVDGKLTTNNTKHC